MKFVVDSAAAVISVFSFVMVVFSLVNQNPIAAAIWFAVGFVLAGWHGEEE